MRTVEAIAELRAALRPARAAGGTIGLVPTMGALHEGHLSLVRRARGECDVVVASVFVNPTQFAPGEDLARYPRDLERDAALLATEGVDMLFAPLPLTIYPEGFATTITVAGVSTVLEGAQRGRSHFDGVATVVTKLLNIVAPDVAYFGQKDAQQVAVLRRLVRDLDLPVLLEVCPTVREPDGLAMSSRNAYLGPDDRERAVALRRGLLAARDALAAGDDDADALISRANAAIAEHGVSAEYVALVDPDSFAAVERVRAPALLAIAARVGDTRLIDNELLVPAPLPSPLPDPQNGAAMQRVMLKSKIHRASVTDCDLHYVGSITVDPDLLEAADILDNEQVHVVDVDNGARFVTYAIRGERGSGDMKVNGAAARLVQRGDTIIVFSYASYDRVDLEDYVPRVVHVNAANEIVIVDDRVGEWAAADPATA